MHWDPTLKASRGCCADTGTEGGVELEKGGTEIRRRGLDGRRWVDPGETDE